MRWITEKTEFDELILSARDCVYIDSGREPTSLNCLVFDYADLSSMEFASLLNRLMELSEDQSVYYTVLDPDPVQYFYRLFGRYSCVEIQPTDLPALYLKTLNEAPPNGNLADAIGVNALAFTFHVPSKAWFIHALYSPDDNGGHLWVPRDWINKIEEVFPYYQLAKVFH